MILVDKSKISIFDYLLLLSSVIIAGRATVFARGFGSLSSLSTYLMLVMSVIALRKYKPVFVEGYYRGLLFAIGYITIEFVVNHFFAVGNYLNWFIYITVFYAIYNTFKEKFLVAYETVLCHLCIIAIGLWGIYIIAPDVLLSVMTKFRFSDTYSDTLEVINSVIYTVYADHSFDSSFFSLPRNCGFAWEPGAFSCFICFAIYANIQRTNFSLKNNLALIVFLVALFSTQSTTGILIFGITLLVWALLNRKYAYILLIIPIFSYIWGMSFVGDKFMSEYDSVEMTAEHNVGRLTSFMIYWQDFVQHPIFGGMGDSNSLIFREGYAEFLYSGIGQMLSYYGIVFTLIFIWTAAKSGIQQSALYKTNNGFLLIVILLGSLVSYNFWDQPVLMCFWLSGLFLANRKEEKELI